ncbi:hypothetical protein [Natrinema sp. CBA1119]|uniref:hypothetical protein n=1 Tax=Natrinema sp. CBA1119 TaxID=1608465 RepID=UPI001145D845|nr:hypothetical protein [Natrinema sp. CBA1119]
MDKLFTEPRHVIVGRDAVLEFSNERPSMSAKRVVEITTPSSGANGVIRERVGWGSSPSLSYICDPSKEIIEQAAYWCI